MLVRAFTQNGLLKIMLKSFFQYYIYNIRAFGANSWWYEYDHYREATWGDEKELFFWILFKLLNN